MMDVCTCNWSNLIGQGSKRLYGKTLDVALKWKEKMKLFVANSIFDFSGCEVLGVLCAVRIECDIGFS